MRRRSSSARATILAVTSSIGVVFRMEIELLVTARFVLGWLLLLGILVLGWFTILAIFVGDFLFALTLSSLVEQGSSFEGFLTGCYRIVETIVKG